MEKTTLRRELTLLDATGIGVGAVIGAGIFVVIGVAAGVAGPSFLIGLFIAGLAATCNGLSSAQLAAIYPQSGGTYEYGYRILNPHFGFSAGWMFLTSKLAAGGVVAIGFGNYFAQLFPSIPEKYPTIVGVILLTFANYFGIKKAGKINLGIVAITVLSLLIFIVSGIGFIQSSNFEPFFTHGSSGMIQAAALMFFAFTGYARITTIGEEVKQPAKTIPRAIVLTLIITFFLYLLVAFVAVGVIGTTQLNASSSPLIAAAQTMSFHLAPLVISIGATTAMFGVLLSQILGISRMMLAMARRQDLPSVLTYIHPRYQVPTSGIIASGAIILLIALFGQLYYVVSAASFSILVYYSIANLAAIRLKISTRMIPTWVSIFGLIFCLILAFSLSWQTIVSGSVILLVGHIFRTIVLQIRKQR